MGRQFLQSALAEIRQTFEPYLAKQSGVFKTIWNATTDGGSLIVCLFRMPDGELIGTLGLQVTDGRERFYFSSRKERAFIENDPHKLVKMILQAEHFVAERQKIAKAEIEKIHLANARYKREIEALRRELQGCGATLFHKPISVDDEEHWVLPDSYGVIFYNNRVQITEWYDRSASGRHYPANSPAYTAKTSWFRPSCFKRQLKKVLCGDK